MCITHVLCSRHVHVQYLYILVSRYLSAASLSANIGHIAAVLRPSAASSRLQLLAMVLSEALEDDVVPGTCLLLASCQLGKRARQTIKQHVSYNVPWSLARLHPPVLVGLETTNTTHGS